MREIDKAILTLQVLFANSDAKIYGKAIDLAIQALEEKKQREWVKCSERLPEINIFVLVSCENKKVVRAFLNEHGNWSDKYNWAVYATHWMSLPQPYKEANHE